MREQSIKRPTWPAGAEDHASLRVARSPLKGAMDRPANDGKPCEELAPQRRNPKALALANEEGLNQQKPDVLVKRVFREDRGALIGLCVVDFPQR